MHSARKSTAKKLRNEHLLILVLLLLQSLSLYHFLRTTSIEHSARFATAAEHCPEKTFPAIAEAG